MKTLSRILEEYACALAHVCAQGGACSCYLWLFQDFCALAALGFQGKLGVGVGGVAKPRAQLGTESLNEEEALVGL